MSDFFREWRRKIGCVTLLTACLFMSGWVRSQSREDTVRIHRSPQFVHFVRSDLVGLNWIKASNIGGFLNHHEFYYSEEVAGASQVEFINFNTHWNWCGFHFGEGQDKIFGIPISIWIIPYWSIVLPLTLLSAYLLLTTPRREKPNVIVGNENFE
jgi:hypothetical protein